MDKTDARPLADAIQEPTLAAWFKVLQSRRQGNSPVTWDELVELIEEISQRIRNEAT